MNFEVSRIYPGIPEYFNGSGRGLYHYLTGAASWYMLTVITEVFGVRGEMGDLCVEPKLLTEQFDENGKAELTLYFAGKHLHVVIENPQKKQAGSYRVIEAVLDGTAVEGITEGKAVVSKDTVDALRDGVLHELSVVLD